MAGSGRGRGRAAYTFSIETTGFGKGSALADVICKLPPPFPSKDNKPVPLKTGEDEHYMLVLKQDLRRTMKRTPYFLTVEEHQAIERYSRKYQDSEKEQETWTPGAKPKKAKKFEPKSNLDVIKKIEELEKKDDEKKSEDEKDKEGEDEKEAEEPEEYDEEVHEEENDYISSHFEDGDDFGAGSNDNMDEATYCGC